MEEKKKMAQEKLGAVIKPADVIAPGSQVDVITITKGKGFQGSVKRFGVPILARKAAKTRRKAGTLGSWHPARTLRETPQMGQMGFHQRVEYNKWVLNIGDGKDVVPAGGFLGYGNIKSQYVMLSGSVPGPRKRLVFLRGALRPNRRIPKQAPEIEYISKRSKQ
jgi:large subunit ribosomal protein L3